MAYIWRTFFNVSFIQGTWQWYFECIPLAFRFQAQKYDGIRLDKYQEENKRAECDERSAEYIWWEGTTTNTDCPYFKSFSPFFLLAFGGCFW